MKDYCQKCVLPTDYLNIQIDDEGVCQHCRNFKQIDYLGTEKLKEDIQPALALNRSEKYDCVVDLIYNPIETEFIKIGQKLGKITCGGLMMLVLQGIKADEIWENIEINKDIIEELYTILSKEFDKE